jgi:hypothetical protein
LLSLKFCGERHGTLAFSVSPKSLIGIWTGFGASNEEPIEPVFGRGGTGASLLCRKELQLHEQPRPTKLAKMFSLELNESASTQETSVFPWQGIVATDSVYWLLAGRLVLHARMWVSQMGFSDSLSYLSGW